MADQLAEIADDLYSVPPAAFVAERDARAKHLTDDATLRSRVKALRRPAPAAWIVNLLARARRDTLDELLELGEAVRAARESPDREQITRLAHERRDLVATLARAGAELAAQAGHPISPTVAAAVTATLDAGVADAGAAAAIRTGRLVRPLRAEGYEPVDLAEAIALPVAGSRAARIRTPQPARPRPIDDGAAELRRARAHADAVIARAEEDATTSAHALRDVEKRLRVARRSLAAAQREVRDLEGRRDDADDAVGRTRAALDAARARRRDLGR